MAGQSDQMERNRALGASRHPCPEGICGNGKNESARHAVGGEPDGRGATAQPTLRNIVTEGRYDWQSLFFKTPHFFPAAGSGVPIRAPDMLPGSTVSRPEWGVSGRPSGTWPKVRRARRE